MINRSTWITFPVSRTRSLKWFKITNRCSWITRGQSTHTSVMEISHVRTETTGSSKVSILVMASSSTTSMAWYGAPINMSTISPILMSTAQRLWASRTRYAHVRTILGCEVKSSPIRKRTDTLTAGRKTTVASSMVTSTTIAKRCKAKASMLGQCAQRTSMSLVLVVVMTNKEKWTYSTFVAAS